MANEREENSVGNRSNDPLLGKPDIMGTMAVMTNFVPDTSRGQMDDQKEGRSFSQRELESASMKSSFARESSVFQLIIDPNDQNLMKCGNIRRLRKALFTFAVAFIVALLFTMTVLYILERQRRIELTEESENGKYDKATLGKVKTSPSTKTVTTENVTTVTASSTVTASRLPLASTTQQPLIKPLVSGCVPVFEAFPLPSIPPEIQSLTKKLNAEVEGLYESQKFKAASVAFSYRGKIWWSKHVGSLNFIDNNSSLPDNDTPYPIASITKLFTTFMLHKLYENGKLRLDDPVVKHVPEFSIKNPFNNDQVTLRQLSSMMSGMPREGPCYPHDEFNFCPYNSSEMWERISNLSLILPPDKNPSYSNLGYSVLGRALERIADEKYEDWMMKNIIEPLGMKNSGFDLLGNAHRFPVSTNIDGSIARIITWGWQQPAAGLFSSINDLNQVAGLLFELLNGSTVLHKSTARNLFKPAFLFNTGHGTGYGFEIANTGYHKSITTNTKNILEYLIYSKNGASLGYGSWIALIPEFKFAAFVLVAHGGNEFIPHALLNTALKAVKPLEEVLVRSLPKYVLPPTPEAFIGNYSLIQYWPLINNLIRIFQKDGTLFLSMEWLLVPLSFKSPWVLVTGHFKQYPLGACEDYFLSTGLSNLKLYFRRPSKPGGRSPGFYINGITSYGFADFKRV